MTEMQLLTAAFSNVSDKAVQFHKLYHQVSSLSSSKPKNASGVAIPLPMNAQRASLPNPGKVAQSAQRVHELNELKEAREHFKLALFNFDQLLTGAPPGQPNAVLPVRSWFISDQQGTLLCSLQLKTNSYEARLATEITCKRTSDGSQVSARVTLRDLLETFLDGTDIVPLTPHKYQSYVEGGMGRAAVALTSEGCGPSRTASSDCAALFGGADGAVAVRRQPTLAVSAHKIGHSNKGLASAAPPQARAPAPRAGQSSGLVPVGGDGALQAVFKQHIGGHMEQLFNQVHTTEEVQEATQVLQSLQTLQALQQTQQQQQLSQPLLQPQQLLELPHAALQLLALAQREQLEQQAQLVQQLAVIVQAQQMQLAGRAAQPHLQQQLQRAGSMQWEQPAGKAAAAPDGSALEAAQQLRLAAGFLTYWKEEWVRWVAVQRAIPEGLASHHFECIQGAFEMAVRRSDDVQQLFRDTLQTVTGTAVGVLMFLIPFTHERAQQLLQQQQPVLPPLSLQHQQPLPLPSQQLVRQQQLPLASLQHQQPVWQQLPTQQQQALQLPAQQQQQQALQLPAQQQQQQQQALQLPSQQQQQQALQLPSQQQQQALQLQLFYGCVRAVFPRPGSGPQVLPAPAEELTAAALMQYYDPHLPANTACGAVWVAVSQVVCEAVAHQAMQVLAVV